MENTYKDLNYGKVSIILVNYNSSIHTIECVKSLLQNYYDNYEIIIVDNASDEENKGLLTRSIKSDKVSIIFSKQNLGFSYGNNLGIKKALHRGTNYVLLLNNDTVVTKSFLIDIFLNPLFKKEIPSVYTGKILNYYNKELIWYAGGNINKIKGNSEIFGFGQINKCFDDSEKITFISGCYMLIDMQALKLAGYLSEDYFLYYEDTEYSNVLRKKGCRLVYCDCSIIYHKESISTKKASNLYSYYFCRNRLMFIKRNIDGLKKMVAYIYSFLWIVKKIVIGEFKLKFSFKGIIDFFKNKKGKQFIN